MKGISSSTKGHCSMDTLESARSMTVQEMVSKGRFYLRKLATEAGVPDDEETKNEFMAMDNNGMAETIRKTLDRRYGTVSQISLAPIRERMDKRTHEVFSNRELLLQDQRRTKEIAARNELEAYYEKALASWHRREEELLGVISEYRISLGSYEKALKNETAKRMEVETTSAREVSALRHVIEELRGKPKRSRRKRS